jgi:hypothetical protein
LTVLKRGIGGEATKLKIPGWCHTPSLLYNPKSIALISKKLTKNKTKHAQQGGQKIPTSQNNSVLAKLIALSLLTLPTITSCKTCEPQSDRRLSHMMEKQVSLIDALLVERNAAAVKTAIAADAQLLTAEKHLLAALTSMREANNRHPREKKHDK